MLKFEIKKDELRNSKKSAIQHTMDAISNVAFAQELSIQNPVFCANHVKIDSIIEVTVNPKPSYYIKSVCCDEFKEKLDLLLATM